MSSVSLKNIKMGTVNSCFLEPDDLSLPFAYCWWELLSSYYSWLPQQLFLPDRCSELDNNRACETSALDKAFSSSFIPLDLILHFLDILYFLFQYPRVSLILVNFLCEVLLFPLFTFFCVLFLVFCWRWWVWVFVTRLLAVHHVMRPAVKHLCVQLRSFANTGILYMILSSWQLMTVQDVQNGGSRDVVLRVRLFKLAGHIGVIAVQFVGAGILRKLRLLVPFLLRTMCLHQSSSLLKAGFAGCRKECYHGLDYCLRPVHSFMTTSISLKLFDNKKNH